MTRSKRYAVVILTAALVAGCGSDKGAGVGPSGTTIRILPTSISYTPYRGSSIPVALGPDFVTITLLNSSGSPVRGASVVMINRDGDLANSIVASNKNADFDIANLQAEPYVAKTDDFGSIYIWLFTSVTSDRPGSTTYDFEAFSGDAFMPMPVTITCEDENTATTLICD